MRALLERSRSARGAVVVLAAVLVLGLVRSASADDDFGLRRFLFGAEPEAPAVAAVSSAAVPRHHGARRIWAAGRSRPLRVALRRRRHAGRRIAKPLVRAPSAAGVRSPVEAQVVFPRLIALPKPLRPAIVSIYQDRTLREGDAVMMADGIHVFHAIGAWPHRARDFVRLTLSTTLGWHLRQTLNDLDRNPPTRWSSLEVTSG